MTQPAGWYPDPWQQALTRWWDGAQWTGHVQTPGPGAERQPPARWQAPPAPAQRSWLDDVTGKAAGWLRDRRDERHLTHDAGAWVPAGHEVVVAGYRIPGGLLYAGPGLASLSGLVMEPALIDPRLPVDTARPDRGGAGLPYWPSYGEIPPQTRAAYLEWLATGRDRPGVNVGFVFLYFYGLERRLWELIAAGEGGETPDVHDEVVRLLALYGAQPSFRRYGLDLLDVLQALLAAGGAWNWTDTDPAVLIPDDRADLDRRGLPLVVHMALAQLSGAGAPLPAGWAYAWWLRHPDTKPPLQLRRAPQEFRLLFLRRYAAAHGTGMVLAQRAPPLGLLYRPASPSFGGEMELAFPGLPDAATLAGPYRALAKLAVDVAGDLDSYSRFVARRPDQKAGLAAAASMPADLFDDLYSRPEGDELVNLDRWLAALVPDGAALASVGAPELVARWPAATPGTLTKAENVALLQVLGRLGWGVEPDIRFGGAGLGRVNRVVLFRTGPRAPDAPSSVWTAAAVLLHLAVAVAAADGGVDDVEKQALAAHIERNLDLGEDDRRRLEARLAHLLLAPPGVAAVRRQLDAFGYSERKSVGEALVGIAAADGEVSPKEARQLERVFEMLDIPPEPVRAAVAGDQPRHDVSAPDVVDVVRIVGDAATDDASGVAPDATAGPSSPAAPGPRAEPVLPPAPSTDPGTVAKGALEAREVYRRASPGVVGVTDGEEVIGTGFFLRDDTLVVTNAHVVEGLARLQVRLGDGPAADAAVLSVVPAADLAFLAVPPAGVAPLRLASVGSVCVGDTVFAIGNPLGLLHTFTKGMVSALGRDVRGQRVLQTDTPINPGNSGGPLLSDRAEVVGVVVSKKMLADGLGFAVPADVVAHYLRGLPGVTPPPR